MCVELTEKQVPMAHLASVTSGCICDFSVPTILTETSSGRVSVQHAGDGMATFIVMGTCDRGSSHHGRPGSAWRDRDRQRDRETMRPWN